jgi:large subunit ribosomal protein L29
MEAKEYREKTVKELGAELNKVKEELFKARVAKASGQLKRLSDLRAKRRDVARIMTVIGEKEKK